MRSPSSWGQLPYNFLHSGWRLRAAAAPPAPSHPARCARAARAARRGRVAGPRAVGRHGSRASPLGARSGGTRRGRRTPPARSRRPPRARSPQYAQDCSGCLGRARAKRSAQRRSVARSLAPRCARHPCHRHPRPQHPRPQHPCPQHRCEPGARRASPGFRTDVRRARRCPWTRRLGWILPRTSAEPLPPPHPAPPPVYEASPPGMQAARWASW